MLVKKVREPLEIIPIKNPRDIMNEEIVNFYEQ